MSKTPIGLQLWSVREEFGKDMVGTLKAVAEMGYEGVEMCRWYDRFTPEFDKWAAEDIRKTCDDLGLKCPSSHIQYHVIGDNMLDELVEFARIMGMSTAIVASVPRENWETRDGVLAIVDKFNRARRELAKEGIRLGYHPHGHDFTPVDGEMPWDIVFSNTDPEFIMQMDVGNVLGGGADPYMYMERYAGRATLAHVKSYNPDNRSAAIGEGIVDWPRWWDLCDRLHQPEWYIVEQGGVDERGAFGRAKASLEALRAMGK